MKAVTNFLKKCKKRTDKEFFIYTGVMLGIMLGIYFYAVYGGMSTAFTFAYAQF